MSSARVCTIGICTATMTLSEYAGPVCSMFVFHYTSVVFVCANAAYNFKNHMDTRVIEVKLNFRFWGQLLCDILPDCSTMQK